MDYSHKGKRFGGGNKFGGGRGSGGNRGGRDGTRLEMHHTTCSNCHKDCEVPFRPSGSKPVFCSDCFKGKEGGESRDSRSPRDRDSRSFGNRDSRPRFPEKRPHRPEQSGSVPNYKADFEQLNNKLDTLIRLLTPASAGIVSPSEKFVRGEKKEVDTAQLQDAIANALASKKTKKGVTKKPTAKKGTKKKK